MNVCIIVSTALLQKKKPSYSQAEGNDQVDVDVRPCTLSLSHTRPNSLSHTITTARHLAIMWVPKLSTIISAQCCAQTKPTSTSPHDKLSGASGS